MSEPAYRIERVAKAYDGRRVVDVEALEIRRGEVFGLVGPSGSGKSTLLRLLGFLEPPTEGGIRFGAEAAGPNLVPAVETRRRVTLVFQRPVLLNRTVAGNVAYGLRIRGWDRIPERVREVLDRVGLAHLASARARSLSGGETQRVALARAIVIDPEVLLLDEPTANLDPYNVGLIERIVADLNRERGTTIVLVTHNVFQARRLAGRAGLLLDGRLIETAESDRFFAEPSDPRTRAFVRGEMIY